MMKSEDVARWMLQQLGESEELHQRDAVAQIEELFGEDFVYENDRGNKAISKEVLEVFREVSGNKVVWVARERLWRFREDWDGEGRSQR